MDYSVEVQILSWAHQYLVRINLPQNYKLFEGYMAAERLYLAPNDIGTLEQQELVAQFERVSQNIQQACQMVSENLKNDDHSNLDQILESASHLLYLRSELLSNPVFALHLLTRQEDLINRAKAAQSSLKKYLTNEGNQHQLAPSTDLYVDIIRVGLQKLIETYIETGITLIGGAGLFSY